MDAEQIRAGAEKVERLLGARGIDPPSSLPPLAGGTENADAAWIEKFLKWLVSLFPKFDKGTGQMHADWLKIAAFVFCGLAACALIAVVLASAFRSVKRTRYIQTGANPTGRFLLDPVQRLERELAQAIKEGRWPKAARLRWRLFLLRTELAPSATPKEILRESGSVDAMMFASDTASADVYRIYETQLAPREKREAP